MNFMKDIISRDEAERVPEEELDSQPVWYIPYHSVYHPQKPEKICVIFDCSARFQDTYRDSRQLSEAQKQVHI